jgi:hypothetical protein
VHQAARVEQRAATTLAQARPRQLLQAGIGGGKQRVTRACFSLPHLVQQLRQLRHASSVIDPRILAPWMSGFDRSPRRDG